MLRKLCIYMIDQYCCLFQITQEPGEFIVTFPFVCHAGCNITEAIFFAIPRLEEYGKKRHIDEALEIP